MNHLWFGEDLKEAISAPVVFVDFTTTLKLENGFHKQADWSGHEQIKLQPVPAVSSRTFSCYKMRKRTCLTTHWMDTGSHSNTARPEPRFWSAHVARSYNKGCKNKFFQRPAVTTDAEVCSDIGCAILDEGGSAVDAAIAALLCIPLIHPQSMGLGGGLMFTVMEKNGKVTIINSRPTVPKVFNPNLLKECSVKNGTKTGSEWIGVPGEILGYKEAYNLYGKLPWPQLFNETIELARKGVKVSRILDRYLKKFNKSIEAHPSLCEVFCDQNKKVLKLHDIVKYEKLADTLDIIAKEGPDAFYNGSIGRDLIQDIKNADGELTMEDLQLFKVNVTEAWNVSIGEYKMFFPPTPSGGALIGFILNVMKGYSLTSDSIKGNQTTLTYHRYVEAYKFANGQRKHMRDLNFYPNKRKAQRLVTEEFAKNIRQKISDNSTRNESDYEVTINMDPLVSGTSHVSVLDENGMAVSVTSTINHPFGSMVYSGKTGIILNNQLADFCEDAGRKDPISPGEQPPSSTAPSVFYSKSKGETLVIGGSGGLWITAGMALALMNHLWFGKDLEEAISAPVVFVNSTNALIFEERFDQTVMEGLRKTGHKSDYNYTDKENVKNVVNAVLRKNDTITKWY
ncbi:hypothetical protein MATL_G00058080 [Megalops atlanticus]|uniref:Glutathione hydrolase n=1 Tax=Megalops atlanticus TaxID=7932 RepID=A0A9D3Q6D5_MEGAT|nr:hypothetical protein MATL_G00058080 [Megalops atlanticus]